MATAFVLEPGPTVYEVLHTIPLAQVPGCHRPEGYRVRSAARKQEGLIISYFDFDTGARLPKVQYQPEHTAACRVGPWRWRRVVAVH